MNLDIADRNASKALFHEFRVASAVGQDVQHFLLSNRHVGLVKGAYLHKVTNHSNGVFPHNEVSRHFLHV